MTREEKLAKLKDQMKSVAEEIKEAEYKRHLCGTVPKAIDFLYVSPNHVRKLKSKFAQLQREHKKLYFKEL